MEHSFVISINLMLLYRLECRFGHSIVQCSFEYVVSAEVSTSTEGPVNDTSDNSQSCWHYFTLQNVLMHPLLGPHFVIVWQFSFLKFGLGISPSSIWEYFSESAEAFFMGLTVHEQMHIGYLKCTLSCFLVVSLMVVTISYTQEPVEKKKKKYASILYYSTCATEFTLA